MTNEKGRSLELFFVEGLPEGMLTARMFNWTGHILVAPRTQLPEALRRPEARNTGVYLLLGEQDNDACVYVGEGDDMSARIRSHDASKDWWQKVVFISTQANTLNKAQVRYLEARLIKEARVRTDNGTSPVPQGLSEAAQADMEAFLANLFVVLPAARIDVFLTRARPKKSSVEVASVDTERFVLRTPKHDIEARAELVDGEFIVLEGSDARLTWASTAKSLDAYARMHQELIDTGVLLVVGNKCEFSESYAFTSPSTAAAIVNGRPANGRIEWKHEQSGVTYSDWEAAKIAKVE